MAKAETANTYADDETGAGNGVSGKEAYGRKQLQSAYALKKGWRDRHNIKEVKDNE